MTLQPKTNFHSFRSSYALISDIECANSVELVNSQQARVKRLVSALFLSLRFKIQDFFFSRLN